MKLFVNAILHNVTCNIFTLLLFAGAFQTVIEVSSQHNSEVQSVRTKRCVTGINRPCDSSAVCYAMDVPCPDPNKKCPEKTCFDGRCVKQSDSCNDGHCNPSEDKTCADRSCVSRNELCKGEKCPYKQPLKCADGRKCYTTKQKCDGVAQCQDGSDEASDLCRVDPNYPVIVAVPTVGIIVLGIIAVACWICCAISRDKRDRRSQRRSNVLNEPTSSIPPGSGHTEHSSIEYRGEGSSISAVPITFSGSSSNNLPISRPQYPYTEAQPSAPPSDEWHTAPAHSAVVEPASSGSVYDPPPSYTDVIRLELQTEEEKPPSYDSVNEMYV